MVLRFPELELQCGFVNGLMHCWTKAAGGEIIDPTKHQFGGGKLEYIFVANHLLRKDQVDETTLTVFLDDGRVVVGI